MDSDDEDLFRRERRKKKRRHTHRDNRSEEDYESLWGFYHYILEDRAGYIHGDEITDMDFVEFIYHYGDELEDFEEWRDGHYPDYWRRMMFCGKPRNWSVPRVLLESLLPAKHLNALPPLISPTTWAQVLTIAIITIIMALEISTISTARSPPIIKTTRLMMTHRLRINQQELSTKLSEVN